MAKARGVKIQDVAREAQVSVSTVSRVVRGHTDVSDETRERVQAVIGRMGYRPSPLARALVSGRSQLLALLVSDITNPWYPELARSIEVHAGRAGYGLVICNTDDDPQNTRRHVQRLLDHGIEGIVHASVGLDALEVSPAAVRDTPVIFVNRRPAAPGASYVVTDNVAGGRLLAEHLIALGHTRIGFVCGPAHAATGQERLRGVQEVVAARDGRVELLVEQGESSKSNGATAVKTWLDRSTMPSAIVGSNDTIALGAMEALVEAELRIPDDVGVAGFDDISSSASGLISLTCIRQQTEKMGEHAVTGLLRLMRANARVPRRPIREVLPAELVIRASTVGRAAFLRQKDGVMSRDAISVGATHVGAAVLAAPE